MVTVINEKAMNPILTTIILLALVIHIPISKAEELLIDTEKLENKTPIERYHFTCEYYLAICKLKFKIASVQAQTAELGGKIERDESDGYEGCIDEGRVIAKTELNKVLPTLKNPKAENTLKNYHVAFITALEGIKPRYDERKIFIYSDYFFNLLNY